MSSLQVAAPVPATPEPRTGLWASLRLFSAPKRGALIAPVAVTFSIGLMLGHSTFLGPAGIYGMILETLLLLIALILLGLLTAGLFGGVTALVQVIRRRRPLWSPRAAREGLYSGLMLGGFGGGTALLTMFSNLKALYFLPYAALLMVVPTVLGLAIGMVLGRGWRPVAAGLLAVAIAANAGLGYFLFYRPSYEPGAPGWDTPPGTRAVQAENPGLPGQYTVKMLTYGSGTDRRSEFGKGAALTAAPVDITPALPNKTGLVGLLRRWVWGFDLTAAPLNGRVWYPEGNGPFPLILFVHGNHAAQDYSDPGYAYLGELLASRGFIFVSVDENYFNGDWIAQSGGEIGLRGYMLLRHIGQWQEWNGAQGNPFYHKVDLNNIALGGHSRGGEASAVAAVLNRAEYYPGLSALKTGFNYHIKAVLALAPSDHQFEPNKQATVPRDINYFVIQGGRDADVTEFQGVCQYQRVQFSGEGYFFKSALWVDNINHGQMNTTWNRDHFLPADWFRNEAPLMPGQTARQIISTYAAAFFEATLHGNQAYLPMMQDYRAGAAWLPQAKFAMLFHDSTLGVVGDFDSAVRATAENLTVKEQNAPLRDQGWVRETKSALLEWQAGGSKPTYALALPEPLPNTWKPLAGASLSFALADATPESQAHDPVDLTVQLEDQSGRVANLPLSRYGAPLKRPVIAITRFGLWEKNWPKGAHGPVLETFTIPLADFAGIDAAQIKTIRFVFDKAPAGSVWLDDVGFRWNP